MATMIDRFETQPRDNGGRVKAGWRITRYTFGRMTIQHLRTGRSHTGSDDGFGNIVYGIGDARLPHDETLDPHVCVISGALLTR